MPAVPCVSKRSIGPGVCWLKSHLFTAAKKKTPVLEVYGERVAEVRFYGVSVVPDYQDQHGVLRSDF